jgi:Tol biopolymer transport system component
VGGNEPLMVSRLSADGASIHYLVNPKLGELSTATRLMRKPLSGGPPELILQADAVNNQQCAIFPGTRCVLSQVTSNPQKLFTYDPAKGMGTEIPNTWVEGEADRFNWSLSPDGNTLVFPRKVGRQLELRFLSIVDGTERAVPAEGLTFIGGADWAPDGKSVWVTGEGATGSYVLINVSLQGKARILLEEKSMTLGWAIPSPDGHRLALWKASGSANVWMLEHF